MITKLTALVLSGIMTVGLIAASAPPVTLHEDPDYKTKVAFALAGGCRQTYNDYLNGKETLQETINKVSPDLRDQMFSTCIGYMFGYIDGEKVHNA